MSDKTADAYRPRRIVTYGRGAAQCSVTIEDDGAHGYDWTMVRNGVLWARGWVRTRTARTAELVAKQAGSAAFAGSLTEVA